MATFSHTVTIPRPPAEVFPWLLDEDKVPRWTSQLESYEYANSRVRETLKLGGQRLTLDIEITRHEPPRAADTRFESNGIEVAMTYRLAEAGAGTELTQSIDAKSTSFTAKFLIPVVQPRLEEKVKEDLERLRELLSST